MSKNKASVPDAWDDDWETQADVSFYRYAVWPRGLTNMQKQAAEPPSPPKQEVKLTKAERKAKHEETNRQIWEDA